MISVKKISHTLVVNILEFAVGFGLTSYATLQYSTTEAGKWMWVMAMVAVQAKIREGITQTALVKYACNGFIKKQLSHRKLNLLITVGFELAVFIILLLISPFMGVDYKEWFPVYVFYSIATSVFRWQMFLWQGTLKTKQLVNTQSAVVLLLGGALLYGYLQQIDLKTLTLALGGIRLLALLPFIDYRAFRLILKSKVHQHHIELIKPYAGFGLLRETTGSLAARAEVLIGGLLLTFSEVAWLGLAARYAQLLLLPNGSIQALVNAKAHQLAHEDTEAMKKLLGQTLMGIWGLFGMALLFFSISAPYWFPYLHGENFVEALPLITLLLCINAFAAPLGGIYGTICHALNKPMLTAKVVLISSAIKITFTVIGLQLFGIWGGVYSIILVEIWGFIYTDKLLRTHLNISWGNILKRGLQGSQGIKAAFLKANKY